VDVDLSGGPSAAARARRLVESELAGRMSVEMIADVSLLVTELVANGVKHGGADERSLLHLMLEGQRRGLRVEVENPNHQPGVPALRSADLTGGGGIGLNLVEMLASRWGVRSVPHTAVWFELDC